MMVKQIKHMYNQAAPLIGERALSGLQTRLSGEAYKERNLYILVDEGTMEHCLPVFIEHVAHAAGGEIIEIPAGEENKDLQICEGIWRALLDLGADRDAVMINLGGGTITDMGGFVASTFKRGISFFNVPTTLMGMVDASIGGKNGVNLDHLKNMIGSFQPADGTYIFPGFLNTLPPTQLTSGFAELMKTALISDEDFWELIKGKNIKKINKWTPLIRRAVEVKMSVVQADPHEQGPRKVLNFGHTIGHAIEAASLQKKSKPLLHGEAIAMGIICEAFLSHHLAGLPEIFLGEIGDVILDNIPLKKINLSPEKLILLMGYDKKNMHGSVRFSLISAPGRVLIDQEAPPRLIADSIAYYNGLIAS